MSAHPSRRPYPGQDWRHGWKPVTPQAVVSKNHGRKPAPGTKAGQQHEDATSRKPATPKASPKPTPSEQADKAIRAMADRKRSRTTPKAAPTAKAAAPTKNATSAKVGDLIPKTDNPSHAEQQRMVAEFGKVMAGKFGNLDVSLASMMSGVDDGEGWVQVDAHIKDKTGKRVGVVSRMFTRHPDGSLSVEHTHLELDREVQGQGFASAYNRRMEDWYRQSGVSRITLTANIDAGGYVWARHGYDWADKDSASKLVGDLERAAAKFNDPAAKAAAADIAHRAKTEKFGSDRYPTPFELSQVGYTDGAQSWPGKELMLGSKWEGMKWLT